MKCVVPLAGPDLYDEGLGFRPLRAHDGRPLIAAALDGRAWRPKLSGSDYVFVVREVGRLSELIGYLHTQWPGCSIVTLSDLTEGALFSCMAGAALAGGAGPLIVDLADILFRSDLDDPAAAFGPEVGAVVPCFRSDEVCYSYLLEEEGRVVEAAEKRVISEKASAGVYMFRDTAAFLRAAAHSIANASRLAYKGVLFVCPMVNGLIAEGLRVTTPDAGPVVPVGKVFHAAP